MCYQQLCMADSTLLSSEWQTSGECALGLLLSSLVHV